MERLGDYWKPLLAITVLAGIGIAVFGPNHMELQMADGADAFRDHLDGPTRHLVAALFDVVFAAGYGLLGVAVLRAIDARGLPGTVAAVTILAGALFDEIENVFLIANIARHEVLTDGWITAMQVPGTLKWIGSIGFVILFVLLILRWRAREA